MNYGHLASRLTSPLGHKVTLDLRQSGKVTKLGSKLGTSETGSENVAGNLRTSVCTVQETLLTVREVAGTRP